METATYTSEELYNFYMTETNYHDLSLMCNLSEGAVREAVETYRNSLADASMHLAKVGDTIKGSIEHEGEHLTVIGTVYKCLSNSVLVNILNDSAKAKFKDLLNRTVVSNRSYVVITADKLGDLNLND